jgi:hypothetical protein
MSQEYVSYSWYNKLSNKRLRMLKVLMKRLRAAFVIINIGVEMILLVRWKMRWIFGLKPPKFFTVS